MSFCRSATDKLFRCVWFINSDLSKGDRKVQTRLKYSAASLWLIGEAQLWIYWWHLTVGHKGGGGRKITLFHVFIFSTSGFYFQANVQVFAVDSYRNVGKKTKEKPSTSWWLLLKTVYKKTPKLYIHQHNYTYIWYILHYWVYSRE